MTQGRSVVDYLGEAASQVANFVARLQSNKSHGNDIRLFENVFFADFIAK